MSLGSKSAPSAVTSGQSSVRRNPCVVAPLAVSRALLVMAPFLSIMEHSSDVQLITVLGVVPVSTTQNPGGSDPLLLLAYICIASPTCRKFEAHCRDRACPRARLSAGR